MKTIAKLVTVAAVLFVASEARAEGPTLAEKCKETGDHATCAAAGAPLEASSPETTLELYSASCSKHPDQCWALVAYAQRMLKKKDGPRAQQILESGCALRSARACSVLAAELEEGERGIPQDVAKAARYHNQACDLGTARSCTLLAVMTEDGRGVRRDARASQRLRAKAETLDRAAGVRAAPNPAQLASDDAQCRKNQDAMKCLAAGTVMQDTDAVKAEELFRLGCTADKTTCGLWGFAIDRYRRDDPGRATRILDEGCASGASLACMVLADLHHSGFRAIARNESRAAELYDKACTQGEPAGCRATAARFRGVKDAGKADELRARAFALEAEADKPALAAQEAWLKDAAQATAREPYVRELDRRRAEWRGMTSRARLAGRSACNASPWSTPVASRRRCRLRTRATPRRARRGAAPSSAWRRRSFPDGRLTPMPTLIPRRDAIDRIRRERGDVPCLMCGIVERKVGAVHVVYEDETHLVSLPRYVRKWGQVTVTPKAHVTRYVDVEPAVWARTNELAHHAARVVERARAPRRTILASTGSSAGELVNSSVHLHIHVIPLYESEDRPADVFSWQEGIYVGEPEEWETLQREYLALW